MHINFKTCKTILGISCILKTKHGNNKHPTQAEWGSGGRRGKEEGRKGKAPGFVCVCRVWLYKLGGGYVGVDIFSLSFLYSLKYMNMQWTKAGRREAQMFTWHVEGEAAHSSRSCLLGTGCVCLEDFWNSSIYYKKSRQGLPNRPPSNQKGFWCPGLRLGHQTEGRSQSKADPVKCDTGGRPPQSRASESRLIRLFFPRTREVCSRPLLPLTAEPEGAGGVPKGCCQVRESITGLEKRPRVFTPERPSWFHGLSPGHIQRICFLSFRG